ncbi:hypothetical protein niasHS_016083 [Heterodera schachtii]|uniref:FAD-binding PCMH-type domain-containing protein n=1 Tax=Heterodera schachtii TaxID=97005 RepID=A0ABD2I4A3_HETSC
MIASKFGQFLLSFFITLLPLAFLASGYKSADECPVKEFNGKCFERNDGNGTEYENWCYQYASTSMNYDQMKPSLILVASSTADVIAAVRFARAKRVNVAVRSGGHQFSGASSASRKNIQLDVSQAFRNVSAGDFAVSEPNGNNGSVAVRVGISFTLLEFFLMMTEKGLFVPAGICGNVHLGGHAQTGGYGVAIRAFGLFADHVLAFDIITADGEALRVERDSNDRHKRDLYYAVLGGSPGNFGVLTHITLQAHRDNDHPNSRAFHAAYTYTYASARNALGLLPEVSELGQDYDLVFTLVSGNQSMPDNLSVPVPPILIVYAQWSNIGGPSQQFDANATDWFKGIEAAFERGGSVRVSGYPRLMEWNVTTPLSQMHLKWTFPAIREYAMPYEKRLYISNWDSAELQKRGWSDWMADQLNKFVVARNEDQQQNQRAASFEMVSQQQNAGGAASAFYRNGLRTDRDGRNLTAFSWRDMTVAGTFDAFFNTTANPKAHQSVLDWHDDTMKGAFGPGGGHFSDLTPENVPKLLLESYGDRRMGNVWHQYHTKAQYDRLLAIKRAVDPAPTVFTPNNFSVGVPAGEPDLAPDSPWLPVAAFPVTARLIRESGLAAVDLYFVGWMLEGQQNAINKTETVRGQRKMAKEKQQKQ